MQQASIVHICNADTHFPKEKKIPFASASYEGHLKDKAQSR